MSNKINLCPGCASPYLQKVRDVGARGEVLYVHSIEAAGSLGVKATGCSFVPKTQKLLQINSGDFLSYGTPLTMQLDSSLVAAPKPAVASPPGD